MDMLLMMAQVSRSMGYDGAGDFHLAGDGGLTRRKPGEEVPHIYAGVAILKPGLLVDAPKGPWSLNLLFDQLIAEGRLCGHVMDGEWLHVGTPEAIPEAEQRFAARAA
jgi:MurNAc alpha-1-phosphate uridylyltransferase